MRTRPVRRLAAALLNLLFLLAWGEPAALRPCPAHDGIVWTGTVHTGAAHTGAAHADAAAVVRTHHEHAAHLGDHACSCLGQCCAAMGVAVPTAQAVRWQVAVRRRAAPIVAERSRVAATAARLLPFANGPPRAA